MVVSELEKVDLATSTKQEKVKQSYLFDLSRVFLRSLGASLRVSLLCIESLTTQHRRGMPIIP